MSLTLRILFCAGLVVLSSANAQRVVTPTSAKAVPPPNAAQLAQLDSLISTEFAKRPLGSITVGVVSGDQLVWTKSYGFSDMERKTPANMDTVYRIGSITKMFTAVMLEQMVEAGKVHLSDPASRYFPKLESIEPKYPGAPPVTLMELATHTSGLCREPDDARRFSRGPTAEWESSLTSALTQVHYSFDPGTRFSYSNVGYAILGAALGRAAGQAYLQYIPDHVLTPLGMTHSALQVEPWMGERLATGYQLDNGQISLTTPLREHTGRGYKVPNGAIYSTVGDMAKFAAFQMGKGPENVLKLSSLESAQNQIEVPANSQLTLGYGLGFFVLRRDQYVAFGHDGEVAGYQAGLYMNHDKGIAVILLANEQGPGSLNVGDLTLRSLDLLSK